jgi:hypothetical protein
MEGLWEECLQGWRAAIAAAWPEVIPNGIWDPEDPARIPYDAGAGFLNPPFAVLGMATLPPSDDWGGDNRVWEAAVDVYYVMEAPVTKAAPLRAKLEHLADYLEVNGLPVGQIIPPEPEIAMSDMLPPNALLMMLSSTQRAGRLRATCILGVTRP